MCIFLISITNISYGSEQFMMYFFGTVFFLAGLFIGLNVPVFGIIFLFSHGGSGFGIISTIFYNVSKKIRDKKYSLLIILAMFAIGITIIQVLPMIYNIPLGS